MKELVKKIKPVYKFTKSLKDRYKYCSQKIRWQVEDFGCVYTRTFLPDIVEEIEQAENIGDIAYVYYNLRFLESKVMNSDEAYISYDKKKKLFYGNLTYLAECIMNNADVINVAKCECPSYTRIIPECSEKEIRYLRGHMLRIKFREKHYFGGAGTFYQSYEPLAIPGSRDTAYRIKVYQLDNYINKNMDILNIGCNCGFLDCMIAGKVKSITGIEYDEYFLQFANELKQIEGIYNVTFIAGDFKTINLQKKYDMIFSFAVHKWIGLPLEEYFSRLYNMLNEGGIVLFETHGINSYDKGLETVLESVIHGKFESIRNGDIDDGFKGGGNTRKFYYLKKVVCNRQT